MYLIIMGYMDGIQMREIRMQNYYCYLNIFLL